VKITNSIEGNVPGFAYISSMGRTQSNFTLGSSQIHTQDHKTHKEKKEKKQRASQIMWDEKEKRKQGLRNIFL